MAGLGTLINMAAIVAGTAAGAVAGSRVSERLRTTVMQGVGLAVLALGISNSLKTRNLVFPLVAVVVGGFIGEALGIEERLERLGERIRRRVERSADAEVEGAPHGGGDATAPEADRGGETRPSTFVEGFVAATLVFCVGPLAILGSIDDGLNGNIEVLVVKAALDGLVSLIFAGTLGWGVGFSAVAVGLYQGSLTLLAGQADRLLTDRMTLEMTATGGLLVMGIGLRLLDIKPVRVASFLPALAIAPLLVAAFAR
jgi:uncharacterized membrane protein YqgA involved in biofilm formation